MIISINFPTPSTSKWSPTLPPQLARIGHDEIVLVELQGALEVECNSSGERDGKPVGKLRIDESGVSPAIGSRPSCQYGLTTLFCCFPEDQAHTHDRTPPTRGQDSHPPKTARRPSPHSQSGPSAQDFSQSKRGLRE
jgi:hypothetical protein